MAVNARDRLASIIIPCWNQLEYTRFCLPALVRHTRPPWELIVIDNGSTDGTGIYLAGAHGPAGSDLFVSYFWRPKAKDGQLELVALACSGGAERDIPECGRTLRKLESLTAGHGF